MSVCICVLFVLYLCYYCLLLFWLVFSIFLFSNREKEKMELGHWERGKILEELGEENGDQKIVSKFLFSKKYSINFGSNMWV